MAEEEYVVIDEDFLRTLLESQGRIIALLERILEKLEKDN